MEGETTADAGFDPPSQSVRGARELCAFVLPDPARALLSAGGADFLMQALSSGAPGARGPVEVVGEAPRTACRNSLSSPWG